MWSCRRTSRAINDKSVINHSVGRRYFLNSYWLLRLFFQNMVRFSTLFKTINFCYILTKSMVWCEFGRNSFGWLRSWSCGYGHTAKQIYKQIYRYFLKTTFWLLGTQNSYLQEISKIFLFHTSNVNIIAKILLYQ